MDREAYWQGITPLPGGSMEEDVHTCMSLLADVLACLRAQSWLYQTSHWQTAGVPAYGNHLLFMRLYESVQPEIDTLAEKMVGYFGLAAVDSKPLVDMTARLVGRWVEHASCHVKRGLHAEDQFQQCVASAYHRIKATGRMTLGLDDFLMGIASNHESHTYLLQQLLVNVDALNDAYDAEAEAYEGLKTVTPVTIPEFPAKTAGLEEGELWRAEKLADGSWAVEGEVTEEDFNSAMQVIEADLRSKTATPHGGWGGEMSPIEKSWGGFSSFSPIKRSEEDDEVEGCDECDGDCGEAEACDCGTPDQLPGGLGDDAVLEDFDPKQVEKGVGVEQEHTDDPSIALEIAFDHLTEDPIYYDKLETIERHAAVGDKAAPSVEYLFRDDPKRYELTQFVKSKRDTNLDTDPDTPPTPVEIKEQPGGKSLSTLHRYVVDTEQPDAKEADGIEEHPPLSDFKDWTTVRE